jgi:hypothetical protein
MTPPRSFVSSAALVLIALGPALGVDVLVGVATMLGQANTAEEQDELRTALSS